MRSAQPENVFQILFVIPASWQYGLGRDLHTESIEFSIQFFYFISIAHLTVDIIAKQLYRNLNVGGGPDSKRTHPLPDDTDSV